MTRFWTKINAQRKATAIVCVFLLGFAMGFFVEWRVSIGRETNAVFNFQKIHPLNNPYTFINPLIGFDISEKKHGEYGNLKNRIQALLNDSDVSRAIKNISVYFRNLESGEWVGINQNENYDPASLLKVPVMIFYFKLAESNPRILSHTYAYTANDMALLKNALGADTSTRLVQDRLYTVDELIAEMILRSDNIAKYLLILNSPQNDLNNIYGDLGVQIYKESATRYLISTQTYSLFFRTLYNATYLNREMSEKALALLSKADFKHGIVAGVPSDIHIAHKFGQYSDMENRHLVSVEAHDCGIIYAAPSPYLLCVMTKGYDTKQLQNIIQQISTLTYDFFINK